MEVQTYASSGRLKMTPFQAAWVPSSSRIVAVGCQPPSAGGRGTVGVVQIHKLSAASSADGSQIGGKLEVIAEVERPQVEGIKCGSFKASAGTDRQLLTGDFQGQLALWDVDRLESGPHTTLSAHRQIVNCIDATSESPLVASGSRDGCVNVCDLRQRQGAVKCLEFPESDCWAVSWIPDAASPSIVAGYDDGMIYLTEMRMNSIRWKHHLVNSSGVCSLSYNKGRLLATTVDDHFTLVDMRIDPMSNKVVQPENRIQAKKKATEHTTWGAHFNPHNNDVFITTGGNGNLEVYKIVQLANDKLGVELVGGQTVGTQPIVSLDWHVSKEGLFALSSLDNTLQVGFVP